MPLTRIKNTAIGDGGISTAKLADGAVTTVKVADSAVNSAKIGVDVIVADDLAANSVTVSEITDGAVTGAKLADNLNYDSGTLYLDSTNNRVGLGTTAPNSQLEIKNSDGATGVELHREFSGNVSGETNSGRMDFTLSDTATSNQVVARIAPQGIAGSGDAFAGNFRVFVADTSGTPAERMRIDSSGNLLVGKTAEGVNTVGVQLRPDGFIGSTRDGGTPMYLQRQTSDGEILRFQNSSGTVGSIGVADSGDRIYLAGPGLEGVGIDNGANAFVPTSEAGAFKDNHLSLGRADARFTDLYLSGGVYVGGTAAANRLDDYEEGEWTPIVYGSTSGTATGSSGAGSGGSYVKIGNYVWLSFYFANPSISGTMSGDLYLGPLPFTQDNNDRFDNGAGGEIMTHRYFNSGSSTRKITMKISRGESRALFRKQDFGSNNEDSPLNQSTAGVITSTLIWGHLRMRVT